MGKPEVVVLESKMARNTAKCAATWKIDGKSASLKWLIDRR